MTGPTNDELLGIAKAQGLVPDADDGLARLNFKEAATTLVEDFAYDLADLIDIIAEIDNEDIAVNYGMLMAIIDRGV